jgi:hypothetical protein
MGRAVTRIGKASRISTSVVLTYSIVAFGLFVIFSTAAASATDFPARKPGLWKITITGADSFAVRQCSDVASDQTILQAGISFSSECTKPDVQVTGNTITMDSVCKSGGKSSTSHIIITGSLDSKYTMTMSGQTKKSLTLNAEWLGACEANQKPGDVIMPNGMKINLLAAERRISPQGHDSAQAHASATH